MKHQNTAFRRDNQAINFDFLGEEISSLGGMLLLEKIETVCHIIKNFSELIPNKRQCGKIVHTIEKMLKQRVFTMVMGHEDCNDEQYLRSDPVVTDILGGKLASQPTLSRFENEMSMSDVYRMSEFFIDYYVNSIDPHRKFIIIDPDGTNDPTHGNQQLSMFNGYYKHDIYNILLFHDGETGQVILPVLRAGSSSSNHLFVHILSIIVDKIRARLPEMKIIIRADSGFTGPDFYDLAEEKQLLFCIGMPANNRLRPFTEQGEKAVKAVFADQGEKYQFFTGAFQYQAKSWTKPENCYAKIESTGIGMNVRYFCSNIPNRTAREIYWNFYVKRGDASENRIKELKNMCFADRLSCHKFTANYLRLFISCLAYEIFRMIKILIKKTGNKAASKWQIDNIRLYLLKIAATVRKRVKSITFRFSKSYTRRKLFYDIVALC